EGTPTFTGAGTIQLNASGATFAQNARPATWGAAIDGATSAGITAILRTGSGAGTWSGNNSYTGRLVIGSGAAVGAGTFNNVNAFGAGGVGNETICSAAVGSTTIQVGLAGGITIANEIISLSEGGGGGVSSNGQLASVSGTNTWAGTINIAGTSNNAGTGLGGIGATSGNT